MAARWSAFCGISVLLLFACSDGSSPPPEGTVDAAPPSVDTFQGETDAAADQTTPPDQTLAVDTNTDTESFGDSSLDQTILPIDQSVIPDISVDATLPVAMVVKGNILLSKNYPKNLYSLFYASFGASSKMARGTLWARFCEDAACNTVEETVKVEVPGADANGYALYSTGFAKAVTVQTSLLPGTHYLQFVLDTQYSIDEGKGSCSPGKCPQDADTLQTDSDTLQANNAGGTEYNPPAATTAIFVNSGGGTTTLSNTIYLGHIVFSGEELWANPPSESGKILVATSNGGLLNAMKTIDLQTYGIEPSSYVMQRAGGDYQGDICGTVRGDNALYAMGITSGFGAHIFELDPKTGIQVGSEAIAFIPHQDHSGVEADGPDFTISAEFYPRPCRGVFVKATDGSRHLYLLQFKGAGSLDTSGPNPLYHVNLTTPATTEALFSSATNQAWRAIDVANNKLFVAEMSYSKDNKTDVKKNKVCTIALTSNGSASATVDCTATEYTSQEKCDSQLHWPSDMKVISLAGTNYIALGHDKGVAVFKASDLTFSHDVDLQQFGTLVGYLAFSPDGSSLYAMPQCKANTAVSWFTLPYGASTEKSDRNLVAALDLTGATLKVANTSIDIDNDGTMDNGIDIDYFFIKNYIRSFGSTLSIPPVVYTGPQMVVTEKVLVVRGTGIQGNGTTTVSSSGMGQVQDIGFFDLAGGKGLVFENYMPFFDGLSANAGQGAAIWGFDLGKDDEENATRALTYLP
jgi:hypothetical protein